MRKFLVVLIASLSAVALANDKHHSSQGMSTRSKWYQLADPSGSSKVQSSQAQTASPTSKSSSTEAIGAGISEPQRKTNNQRHIEELRNRLNGSRGKGVK